MGQVWPAQNLQDIPGTIVQGRWDVVTPVVTAWHLHQRWPDNTLRIVPEAGHASSDPDLRQPLIKPLDDRADRADRAEKMMNEAEISNSI